MPAALSAVFAATLAKKSLFCEIKSASDTSELVTLGQNKGVLKERLYMFQQQSPVISKAPSQSDDLPESIAPRAKVWSQLTARIRSWFEVPYGYEDESGFHYGVQPGPTAPRLATEATSIRARVLTDRADHVMKHSVVLPTAATPAPSNASTVPEKKAEAVHP